jgi:hypothetical protein
MTRKAWYLAAGGVLVDLVAFVAAQDRSAGRRKQARLPRKRPPKPRVAGREADVAAVRRATDASIKAVEKGDPGAVAAFWTQEGKYTDDDGTTLRGRAAIEKSYAQSFATHRTASAG